MQIIIYCIYIAHGKIITETLSFRCAASQLRNSLLIDIRPLDLLDCFRQNFKTVSISTKSICASDLTSLSTGVGHSTQAQDSRTGFCRRRIVEQDLQAYDSMTGFPGVGLSYVGQQDMVRRRRTWFVGIGLFVRESDRKRSLS